MNGATGAMYWMKEILGRHWQMTETTPYKCSRKYTAYINVLFTKEIDLDCGFSWCSLMKLLRTILYILATPKKRIYQAPLSHYFLKKITDHPFYL